MRILALGDSHFEEGARFEECLRIHAWVADYVRDNEIDAVLHAGDVYEKASSPNERKAVADWLVSVADRCRVIIVRGNHDARQDCALLARLMTKHDVHVVEGVDTVDLGEDVVVGCMAWPSKANLAAMIGRPISQQALDEEARACLRDVLRGISVDPVYSAAKCKILLTHAMIDGAETSTGQPLIGMPLNVTLNDLAMSNADLVLAGHVHKPQAWETENLAGNPMKVMYTGSPFRTAFGETEEKSVTVITVEDGRIDSIRVPTPARKMLLVDMWWRRLEDDPQDEAIASKQGQLVLTKPLSEYGDGGTRDTEMRIRYTVQSDQRELAKGAAEELRQLYLMQGAASVKIEEQVEVTTRARAPEIATARTIVDKLDALWRSRGDMPDVGRRDRLLSKLSVLETAE